MKKIIWMVLAAFIASATVMAQDAPKKKKGGFWNKVKKGVESATGIDVSKEALFVYPELGKWKLQLKSADGNPETGVVTVVFDVMPLAGQQTGSLRMLEVVDGEGRTLVAGKEWEHGSNSHDVSPNTYTEYQLRPITVAPGMKSLKVIKFRIGNMEGFEARDIPLTWTKTE